MSILALGRKQKEKSFQSKERKKAKRANSQSKIERKQKKKKEERKENSRSRIGRKQKKYAGRSLDQTISEQYRIVTKVNMKRKETTT